MKKRYIHTYIQKYGNALDLRKINKEEREKDLLKDREIERLYVYLNSFN